MTFTSAVILELLQLIQRLFGNRRSLRQRAGIERQSGRAYVRASQ